jgi:hypothetical protein
MGFLDKYKYFCPHHLVEMKTDWDWSDTLTYECPVCGHLEDMEPIEATPITQEEIAEKRRQFIDGVKAILYGDAEHFWIPFHYDVIHPLQYSRGPWLTGEWAEEAGKPYVCTYLTTKVDTLGYCYGEVIADGYPDKNDTDESIGDYFDFLISGLDEYGCLDGKLVSAPRELLNGRVRGDMVV